MFSYGTKCDTTKCDEDESCGCASAGVFAVYHVTKDGWKKVIGADVGQLHYKYYPEPELHPTFNPVL